MLSDYCYLIIALLMLPTVAFQAIPLFIKKHTPPFVTYIVSLTINIGYGLLFGNLDEIIAGLVILLFVLFYIIFLAKHLDSACSLNHQKMYFVKGEMCSRPINSSEFVSEISGNRALPPKVIVSGEAYHIKYHYSTSTYRDSKGNKYKKTTISRKTTHKITQELKYASWQEDGNPIRIKETNFIHATCPVHYFLDEGACDELNRIRSEVFNAIKNKDVYFSVNNTFLTPDKKDDITGYLSKKRSCVSRFYQNRWGRLAWYFFTILGYQSAFESIWCMQEERIRIRLKKKISMNPTAFRCAYGMKDFQAANTTFRTDNGKIDIQQSLIPSDEFSAHLQPPQALSSTLQQIPAPQVPPPQVRYEVAPGISAADWYGVDPIQP